MVRLGQREGSREGEGSHLRVEDCDLFGRAAVSDGRPEESGLAVVHRRHRRIRACENIVAEAREHGRVGFHFGYAFGPHEVK